MDNNIVKITSPFEEKNAYCLYEALLTLKNKETIYIFGKYKPKNREDIKSGILSNYGGNK